MSNLDVTKELVALGVPEREAQKLLGTINGNDLMSLIDALSRRTPQGSPDANRILGKYGIKPRSNQMANNYLGAKFESIRRGTSLDEGFGVLSPVNEAFTYALKVTETTRDKVLDWLDENKLPYQATSALDYQIECNDRETAYRAGRALSEILRKPTVRDSIEVQEAKKPSINKRVQSAKDKMATISPKDPNIDSLIARSGSGVHKAGKDPRKEDDKGRKAKHKPRFDEAETDLKEGVMAIKPMNPLFRLRELAGLPKGAEDDFAGIEIADAPEIDPKGLLSAGPVGADAPEDMDVDGMGSDPVADPMADMDGGMDAEIGDIDAPVDATLDINDDPMPDTDIDVSDQVDPMGDLGVPGELGADPMEPAPEMPGASPEFPGALGGVGPGLAPPGAGSMTMTPSQSDAMAQIEDALNSIQTGLADIRLSEYKSLVKKLQDLTNQAQMMGRDYLGERRKK
jgi:hypothetical protein